MNFTIEIEVIRALVTVMIFLYLLWIDKNHDFRKWKGWLYIVNGFFLLSFATTIDITDNFPFLGRYIVIGPTELETFLEKIVGYLFGSILLAIGFFKFFPVVSKLHREVNARKKAENFTERILSTVDEGFIIIDSQYNIISANNAFLKQVGMTSEEVLRKKCYKISHQTPRPCYEEGEECAVKNTFLTGKPHTVIHKHLQNSGSAVFFEIKSYPMEIENGKVKTVIEVLNDITEKKNIEEQFIQAQKMEAVGRMAGGIAHDFNNILVGIIGYSELVLKDFDKNNPLRKYVEEVKKAGKRAASLTRQLLTFSRRQVFQPKNINLNNLIMDMKGMLYPLIEEDTKFQTVLSESIGLIKADPIQLEQVVLNLVVNAKDAMPYGGNIIIETKNIDIDESPAGLSKVAEKGKYVLLSVADDGLGMDEETKLKIFEPFFTSKDVGKGTGLGLSTVHTIVKESGGYISVDSTPGKGTTFRIYLPIIEEKIEDNTSDNLIEESLEGSETILVVEDEDMVKKLILDVLKQKGYTLLYASNGNKALQIIKKHSKKIDLLLTDLIMPGMTGKELASKVFQYFPNINILYMSGYTNKAISDSSKLKDGEFFIQKPFTPEELTKKIHNIFSKIPTGSHLVQQ